jgi:hypothetical protein
MIEMVSGMNRTAVIYASQPMRWERWSVWSRTRRKPANVSNERSVSACARTGRVQI